MKKTPTFFTLTFVWALLIVFTISARAQVTTADITGAVLDATGKIVPGATVTATNVGTSLSRTTTTNESGEYRISELPPGVYNLTVEAQNFSRAILKDLELTVGSRRTVNVDLRPGEVTETVEITADGNLIETTKSELDQSITSREVTNLPLLNRTFAGLSVIAPEARPVGNFDPTKTRIGSFAMNGGDGRQVSVNVDGGDNKDNVVGSLLQNFSYEGIQEFQVLQHRWTAEQGRAVGGVVNVITKSGTNSFRGSFFSNFRDEEIRRDDFFDKQARLTNPNYEKPEFNRQEIGGSLGGPVLKDRLFFFFALEHFRERANARVRPDAVTNLQLIPGIQFVQEIPTPYNDTLLSAKVDHKINDKQSMFYRYSYQNNDAENDQIQVPPITDLTGGNTSVNKLHSFVVNHTYNFTPNTLNQFTFHAQNFFNEILGVTSNPLVTFGNPSLYQIGPNTNVPQSTTVRKYQFRDDFSWVNGNHTFKFGTNYIYTDLGGYFYFGAKGYTVNFFDTPQVISTNTVRYPQGFATPGAVRTIAFAEGEASHDQIVNQLAFYAQDDWRITRKLTLNLGLRWDANIGNLNDQTNNRTIQILQQLNNDPYVQSIVGDTEKLSRTTPSWTEFQPRIGFAYDPTGEGKTVIRGGYGIFYDQLFQNLTIFSLTQTQPSIYQQALTLTNSDVGVGQLANFRYGIDPLPNPPAGFNFGNLSVGGFGRINDPNITEPYVQKWSIGVQTELGRGITLSSDYVHTLGLFEPRVQNINPRIENICNPLYPGVPATPSSQLCPRGVNTRRLDRAFLNAGLPANRLEQINMIGTTNRSLFDSWTTQLKIRRQKMLFNASYVLASSRSWGGQPVASYSGNGIAITPENQFKEEEFGPTRLDERHRIVLSGVFELPFGFQASPIVQYASARPYSPTAGVDLDGDGLATNDRLCEGLDPLQVLQAVRNRPVSIANNTQIPVAPSTFIFTQVQRGCRQTRVNSQRKGFIINSQGEIEERDGRFFNVDVRLSREFRFGERFRLSAYTDLYNLFNTENLAFALRPEFSPATGAGLNARAAVGTAPALTAQSGSFLQPVSLFGPGFGPPVGRPLTVQFGFRFTF